MVTIELHTDSSLGLTMGLYMGMMLFTVLFSVVFLVTPNFWFAFYLLLSTELTSSWNYTFMFHPLVAMVSMSSSIHMRNGNFSSCALLCTYLQWISGFSFLYFGCFVYLAAFGEGLFKADSVYKAIFTCLLLILSETSKEACQDKTSLYTSNFDSFEVYPISSHINEFFTEC